MKNDRHIRQAEKRAARAIKIRREIKRGAREVF